MQVVNHIAATTFEINTWHCEYHIVTCLHRWKHYRFNIGVRKHIVTIYITAFISILHVHKTKEMKSNMLELLIITKQELMTTQVVIHTHHICTLVDRNKHILFEGLIWPCHIII